MELFGRNALRKTGDQYKTCREAKLSISLKVKSPRKSCLNDNGTREVAVTAKKSYSATSGMYKFSFTV